MKAKQVKENFLIWLNHLSKKFNLSVCGDYVRIFKKIIVFLNFVSTPVLMEAYLSGGSI